MTAKTTEQILAERGSSHGDYGEMSKTTMDIMRALQSATGWASLPDVVQVFFFNMAQKSARIVTGNPYEPDHYADIAGYATLAQRFVSPAADAETTTIIDSATITDSKVGTINLGEKLRQEMRTIAEAVVAEQSRPSADPIANLGTIGPLDFTKSDPLTPALVAAGLTSGLAAPVETLTQTVASPGPAAGATVAGDPPTAAATVPPVPDVLPAAATAPTAEEGDAGVVVLAVGPEPESTRVVAGATPTARRRLL